MAWDLWFRHQNPNMMDGCWIPANRTESKGPWEAWQECFSRGAPHCTVGREADYTKITKMEKRVKYF